MKFQLMGPFVVTIAVAPKLLFAEQHRVSHCETRRVAHTLIRMYAPQSAKGERGAYIQDNVGATRD